MRNFLQTAILLIAMTALLGFIGWMLAGTDGLVLTAACGFTFMAFGRDVSSQWTLRAIGASQVSPADVPVLYTIFEEISRRAGLTQLPGLYLLDSTFMVGFSAGTSRHNVNIVLSGPLLQGLNGREIASVLAHEMAHIVAGDLSVMGLADLITRMTRTLSLVGIFLALINLPIAYSGGEHISWAALILLVCAPLVSVFIQFTLSRVREFEADAKAVHISGDPEALCSALEKMEIHQKALWRNLLIPVKPGSEPSLLRSHPLTAQRIRHIRTIEPVNDPLPETLFASTIQKGDHGPVGAPVRWLLRWWR